MDQEKLTGPGLTARSATWHEFITFLTDDIFGKEICDSIRAHRPNLKPPGENEQVFDLQLEDWEWRLFETADAIREYLKDRGPFMPQARSAYLGRAANAILDIFWSEVKLRHPELWRPDSIGIRVDESGGKVLVGFRNSNEGMSLGPFKIMGPHGSE